MKKVTIFVVTKSTIEVDDELAEAIIQGDLDAYDEAMGEAVEAANDTAAGFVVEDAFRVVALDEGAPQLGQTAHVLCLLETSQNPAAAKAFRAFQVGLIGALCEVEKENP